MPEDSPNRRIMRNTVYLYLRSFIIMGVGLFTSRIILQALGVDDFGLYGVVGSVVGMFTILNGVLSVGTSRFLTFELGRGDKERLKKIFNVAFALHCCMAVILFILFETVGLWLLNHKINMPVGREFASNVVYQLSVITCLVGVTQVPYGSVIIAHERIDLYAKIGMLEVFLKLFLIYSLLFLSFGDNLIAYAVILALWSIGLQVFYRFYCFRHFPETHLMWVREKSYYKSMVTYSLWDFIGQFCVTGNGQGLNILINMFFGVKVNAARSVAYQAEGKIDQFSGNIMTSIQPQIVKAYAQHDLSRFFMLIKEGGRYSFFLMFFFALPVFLEADFLLNVWLVEVPKWSVLFLRCIMAITLFRTFARPLIAGVHATGNIKFLNMSSGLYSVSTFLPFIYLLYSNGQSVWTCFCVWGFNSLVTTYLEALSLYRNVKFHMTSYFLTVHLKSIIIGLIASIPAIFPFLLMEQGWLRLIFTTICGLISTSVCVYFLVLSIEMKHKVKAKLLSLIFRNK